MARMQSDGPPLLVTSAFRPCSSDPASTQKGVVFEIWNGGLSDQSLMFSVQVDRIAVKGSEGIWG